MRITDSKIKSLAIPSKGKKTYALETKGLYLRVHGTGTKSFFYRYTSPVTQKRRICTIGIYDEVKLSEANLKAAEYNEQVKRGIDPLEDKKGIIKRNTEAPTLNEAFNAYQEAHRYTVVLDKETGARNKVEKPRYATDHFLWKRVENSLGQHKLRDLTVSQLDHLFKSLADKVSESMANEARLIVSKVINYAIKKEMHAGSNPAQFADKYAKISKDHVLTKQEIKMVWDNCILMRPESAEKINRGTVEKHSDKSEYPSLMLGLLLRFIMITGSRTKEAREAHISEINDEWWTIKGTHMKSGKPVRRPITPLMQEIIDKAREIKAACGIKIGYLFPNPQTGKTYVRDTLAKRINNKSGIKKDKGLSTYELWGVKKFTPHDLRRTYTTLGTSNGIPKSSIRVLTAHYTSEHDVHDVYDLYQYDNESHIVALQMEGIYREILSLPGNEEDIQKAKIELASRSLGIDPKQLRNALLSSGS